MIDTKMRLYILNGKTPVPEPDTVKWAIWLDAHTEERVVAFDMVDTNEWVSTVFIGHDPKHLAPPQLFETLVGGGKSNNETRRYSTWDEALTGHHDIVSSLI